MATRFTKLRASRAFTLVELLVVILIVGVLIAIGLPALLGQQGKAHDSNAQRYLTTAHGAAKAEWVDNSSAYPAADELVEELERSEPQLDFHLDPAGTSPSAHPKDIAVTRHSDDRITLCASSQSGRSYCLRADERGQLITASAPTETLNPFDAETAYADSGVARSTGSGSSSGPCEASARAALADGVSAGGEVNQGACEALPEWTSDLPGGPLIAPQTEEPDPDPTPTPEETEQDPDPSAVGTHDANYTAVVLEDEPTAYWKLDDASASAAADTISSRNLTNVNASGVTSGVPGITGDGTAMRFDGTSGALAWNDYFRENDVYTVEAWVRPASLAGSSDRFFVRNGQTSNQGWGGSIRGASLYVQHAALINSGYTWSAANDWHHVVIRREGGYVRTWVDGVQQSGNYNGNRAVTAGTFRIGSSHNTAYFAGDIDEVAYYNRALDTEDIAEHYAAGAAAQAPENTAAPVASGIAAVGGLLTAENGTWTEGPTSFSYRWQRCDDECSNIAGATSRKYEPTSADFGKQLRVQVTAANAYGGARAPSALTGVVGASRVADYRAAVFADSPSSLWTLDDADGAATAVDSVGTRNLTVNGGVQSAGGGIPGSKGLAFDGKTGHLAWNDYLRETDNWALEAWVSPSYRTGAPVGEQYYVRNGDTSTRGWGGYFSGTQLYMRHFAGVASGYSWTGPGWHHLVLQREGGYVRMYVDGVLQAGSYNGMSNSTSSRFSIGSGNGSGFFAGEIDEVAYYNHVLSPARIVAHCQAAGAC